MTKMTLVDEKAKVTNLVIGHNFYVCRFSITSRKAKESVHFNVVLLGEPRGPPQLVIVSQLCVLIFITFTFFIYI